MKYLFIIAVVMFSYPALAKIAVTGPLLERLEMQRGQSIRKTIKLKNIGRNPTEVKIYLEERDVFDRAKAHSRSNKKWLRIGQNRLTLKAGERRTITYFVQSPSNAAAGSYWSNIIITPIVPKSRETNRSNTKDKFDVAIRSTTGYAVTVLTSITGGKPRYSFSAPKLEKKSGKKVFSVNINNSGSTHGYFTGRLDVFDRGGAKLASLQGGRGPISLLPQANKRIEFPLNGLKLGKYKGLLTAEDLNGGQTFGTDINLTILP